jgi:hypothetical protein
MKKSLVLVLALAMVFSVAIVASAATTTVGGNVRVWYLNTDSNSSKDNTFNFDRLELTTTTNINENAVLFTDFQGRTTNKTVTAESHFFVDQAYYTQKNLLVDGGNLMVGAFDGNPLPFKNGFGTPILSCGLGDGLKTGQAVGAAYAYSNDKFGVGVGIVNANTGFTKNAAGTDDQGYTYTSRFEYKPFAGLKAGVAYANITGLDTAAVADSYVVAQKAGTDSNNVPYAAGDVIKVAGTAAKDGVDQTRLVIDVSYQNLQVTPFSGLIEWGRVDPDKGDADDAIYADVEYTFADAKATAYLSYGDGDIYGKYIKSGMGTFAIKDDNYTCVGLKYALNGNTFLQGEYAKSGKDNDGFGIRLRVNF